MMCCAAWADARFFKWNCYTGVGRWRENETRICYIALPSSITPAAPFIMGAL